MKTLSAIVLLLLASFASACDPTGVHGEDLPTYRLVEGNGQPVGFHRQPLTIATFESGDTRCQLQLRDGLLSRASDGSFYTVAADSEVRCDDGTFRRVSAQSTGKYSLLRGSRLRFEAERVQGLDLKGGTLDGKILRLDAVIDASSMFVLDGESFSVDEQIPVQLVYRETA